LVESSIDGFGEIGMRPRRVICGGLSGLGKGVSRSDATAGSFARIW
jgi:hypothetical protein